MSKRALITGITGQDGSYLAELLLSRDYEVWGIVRRSSSFNTARIDHLLHEPQDEQSRFHLVYGDMLDPSSLSAIMRRITPDEVYNLAAQSHVRLSFDLPVYTMQTIVDGTCALLEACRDLPQPPRFYQASSSEMFGASAPPQSEETPFRPRSPYACAKLAAYELVRVYREAYGLFAVNGILFNHESPRRGETFVTRKITRAVTRIKLGLQDKLFLGNLDARRDWGHARDYVEAMWLMLQATIPGDYVVATGETHTVREFLELACFEAGLDDWQSRVEYDARYARPLEVDYLRGDASLARSTLNWQPQYSFGTLVTEMVAHDHMLARNERRLRDALCT